MKKVMLVLLIASLAFALSLTGCSSDPAAGKSVSITSVEFMSENVDPSFMGDTAGSTAMYDFWVYYDGSIAASDIDYVRIYSSNGRYWTIARQGDTAYVDTANRMIGGLGHWTCDDDRLHMLPIGLMKAEIKLTDGFIASRDFNAYEPGLSAASANTMLYTEDASAPPANSAPMLKRGTIGTVVKTVSSIQVPFSVDDVRVYQARIWFYDANKEAVGQSPLLRDPITGALRSDILGTNVFNLSDGDNLAALDVADIDILTGRSFSDIHEARLVLFDGSQFDLRDDGGIDYSCRSISMGVVF